MDRHARDRCPFQRYGQVAALDGAPFSARRGRLDRFLGRTAAARRRRCARLRPCPAGRGETRWDGRPIDADARLRFGYMPSNAASTRACACASSCSYFADSTASRAAAERRLGPLAGTLRPRRPGQGQAGGPLARQPAARAARGRIGPRAGAAGPRRALLGAGPAGHGDDDRGPSRARDCRSRGRLQQSPARPRRGHLRGRRDHRPRPHRRSGTDRRVARGVRPPPPRGRDRRRR